MRPITKLHLGSALLLALLVTRSPATPQGYLSDETSAPPSIDELPSAFDDISLLRDLRAPGWLVPGAFGQLPETDS